MSLELTVVKETRVLLMILNFFFFSAVDPFLPKYISETVLRRLIKQNIVVELNPHHNENSCYLYKEGVPCDYFVLILQGVYNAR